MGRLLAQNTALTALLLRANFLSLGTAQTLLSHLPTNRTLLELDTSNNLQLRWPGQTVEYSRLFRENVTITSFGASLRADVANAVRAAACSPAK